MSDQSLSADAPLSSMERSEFEKFCTAFRRRQDAISLARQLVQMIKAVQRHRGMSMALLAGDRGFQGDFDILQRQVERRLACLEVFAAKTGGVLTVRDRKNLHNAWLTIRHDWEDDAVIDNFELHSHFIEQLGGMLVALSKKLQRPVSSAVSEKVAEANAVDGTSWPRLFSQIEVLNFVVQQVPRMVEQIARIRGLATYAATVGTCAYHHDRKLRYGLQVTRTEHEKLRHQAERIEEILPGALPSLPLIKTYELKLMFLLNTVEMDVLGGTTITTSSQTLFTMATEIIDVYLQVVEEGIGLIARWHEDDLEAWLVTG